VCRPDDRAVSTTVGYALTLGVAALLITGLLIAGGGFLEDQREATTETQLEVIGEQVSADISSADRLSASDADEVNITRNLPDSVTGSQYTISVRTSPQTHLELRSVDPEVTVRVDVAVQEASLVATDIGGGNIQVSYNRTSDELVLRNADA
jgi:cytoskeletal protein RodZ